MLHHCHVFILLSNRYEKAGPNFVWQGKKSNPFELNFALTLLSSQVSSFYFFLVFVILSVI